MQRAHNVIGSLHFYVVTTLVLQRCDNVILFAGRQSVGCIIVGYTYHGWIYLEVEKVSRFHVKYFYITTSSSRNIILCKSTPIFRSHLDASVGNMYGRKNRRTAKARLCKCYSFLGGIYVPLVLSFALAFHSHTSMLVYKCLNLIFGLTSFWLTSRNQSVNGTDWRTEIIQRDLNPHPQPPLLTLHFFTNFLYYTLEDVDVS